MAKQKESELEQFKVPITELVSKNKLPFSIALIVCFVLNAFGVYLIFLTFQPNDSIIL